MATIVFAVLTGSALLFAEEPEATQSSAALPGMLLCEKSLQCQADVKEDPTFMDECEAFVERAQVHPEAVKKMHACADAAVCATYDSMNCVAVYAIELKAAGVSPAEFSAILGGSEEPVPLDPTNDSQAE